MRPNFTLSAVFSIAVISAVQTTFAQTNIFPSTGAAGIGTTTPDASSLLEVKSTTKGILVPRVTKNQRDAIATPATGLLIYQTNSTPGFYYYSGTAWTAISAKPGWSLTGNAGTISGTNFLGTTDAQPLMFKVSNKKSGLIDFDVAKANTAFGYRSLFSNTTGFSHTAYGYAALYSDSTGYCNTAVGYMALYMNLRSGRNTAIGYQALFSNDGDGNVANGFNALYSNTSGVQNTADGTYALYNNITGCWNAAGGFNALTSNTSGFYNTAYGTEALASNTTASSNSAIGFQSLNKNTTGYGNTASGSQSLYSNTTGVGNTANGEAALYYNIYGYDNTATGESALYVNNGIDNTATGSGALLHNTTGGFNTATGFWSLYNNITGTNNTALGYRADVVSANLSNATAIGASASVDASNKVRIGDNNVTSIGGQVGWTSFSDGRYKKNIKTDVPGLSFINSLKPITYTVDINRLNSYYDKGRKHDSAYEKMKADMQPSADAAAKIVYNGFIAQEVEAAAKKLDYEFSGVDKPKTEDGLYGLRYADFVVPLVKAVQELSAKNDAKDAKISDLETRLAKLEAMMNVQQSAVSKN
ncbi:MAG TPA: tail fiber domain-containing protein [Parafilimonas sp.]|nr:tail fiber domain-containing protein [Parafilimonas sp.]